MRMAAELCSESERLVYAILGLPSTDFVAVER